MRVRKPNGAFRTIPTRVGRTPNERWVARRWEDHPHAGGENFSCGISLFSQGGPSPRGWGEPHTRSNPAPQPRTIPTRVGRTRPWISSVI